MPLGQLLILLTAGGSLLLLAALAGVVVRRGMHEGRASMDAQRGAAFRAAVLPLIGQADEDAVAVLEGWRGDPVALDVASHLLQLLRGGERDNLLRMVEQLGLLRAEIARLASKRPARRIAAVRTLGSFPSASVEAALKHRFRYDAEPAVRLEAGLALVRLGTLPTVAQAIAALDDGAFRAPAHRIVFRALAAQRPSEMIAAWNECGASAARFAIADALGDVFHPGAFDTLRAAIADPDPQMRCEALRAARRLGHPSVVPAVLQALGDPEWIVRVQAAATAGAMRIEAARARLEALTGDGQWWVRYRAAEALAGMRRAAVA